jgi:hypothetical protein
MDTLTSPLLRTSVSRDVDNDTDPVATDSEISALVCFARSRHAHDIVLGSGRSRRAAATAHAIQAAWERHGGRVLRTITWPETGASWLRHATRFAATDPDLWVMTGPAGGWAQMTRRLLWSTGWAPARTLATDGVGDSRTLALVGLHNLDDLAGAYADGSSWIVTDGALTHRARIHSER